MIDDDLIREYEDLERRVKKFHGRLTEVQLNETTDTETFKKRIIQEFNVKLNKTKKEIRELREENEQLKKEINILRCNKPIKARSSKSDGNLLRNQPKIPFRGMQIIPDKFKNYMIKNEIGTEENNTSKLKHKNENTIEPNNNKITLMEKPSKKRVLLSPLKKVLSYKGEPLIRGNISDTQFNNLPTQYSSDIGEDDSVERPQYVSLNKLKKPELMPSSQLIFQSSPERQEDEEEESEIESPLKKKSRIMSQRKSLSFHGDFNFSRKMSKDEVVEDSQEEDYLPITIESDESKVIEDVDDEKEKEKDVRLGKEREVDIKHEKEIQHEEKVEEINFISSENNSPIVSQQSRQTDEQESSSHPLFDITDKYNKDKNHESHNLNQDLNQMDEFMKPAHTALQRKEFSRKYYTMKFEDSKFRINLDFNPITEKKWILEDFKINPKYVKPKVNNNKLGIMTDEQRKNYDLFNELAGKPYGMDDYRLEEDEMTYSQIFDKFPSPPGFMISDFPDTYEENRRKKIVYDRQQDRIKRRIASALLHHYNNKKQGEFIFYEDIINKFVDAGRFIRSQTSSIH